MYVEETLVKVELDPEEVQRIVGALIVAAEHVEDDHEIEMLINMAGDLGAAVGLTIITEDAE